MVAFAHVRANCPVHQMPLARPAVVFRSQAAQQSLLTGNLRD
jgi:hypothetical protein